MSYNINDICRVCLVPNTSRRYSNLFFSSGRSVQLWAKVMACAWVQVFEGDGLPSQICYKCHNKLDIAYQFKQQCEASDAQLRKYLTRTVTSKVSPNNVDLTQNQPECLAECKPLNFNITSECLDLAQSDLSLSTYRLMNQDLTMPQQIDFRIRDSDLAAMKQEPGLIGSWNLFNPLPLSKGDCQFNSYKCESFTDSDMILDSLPAKLFESVSDSIHNDSSEAVDPIDSKLVIWDLQHKEPTSLVNKNVFEISNDKEISQNKSNEILRNVCDTEDLSFLADDRSISPLMKKNDNIPCIMAHNDALPNTNLQNHDYLNKSDKDIFDKNSLIIEETVIALKATFPEEMKPVTSKNRNTAKKDTENTKTRKKQKSSAVKKKKIKHRQERRTGTM